MSFACPGNSNVNPIVQNPIRVVKGFNPNPTPVITSFSTYSSPIDVYTRVEIFGRNFFPFGTTTVTFGPIQNIPVDYISSFSISFTLPVNNNIAISTGIYDVYVVNLNNKTQILPISLYSNKVEYTLTYQSY
jgi:hypothetical protein